MAQVKASASDPECFDESFTKWKAMAILARREFQRSGVRAVEYRIIPKSFLRGANLTIRKIIPLQEPSFVSEKLSAAQDTR